MLATLLFDVHKDWAWFVILGNAAAGIWALAAHKVESLRTKALWWFTGVVEVAILVQVGLGVALEKSEHLPHRKFHEFYGYVAFVSVGLIYAYRAQLKDKIYLLYGFGGLFLMGCGIRAIQVGSRSL